MTIFIKITEEGSLFGKNNEIYWKSGILLKKEE